MRSMLPKVGWMLAGVLALFVISGLAGVVSGGPLDPPGPVGSTMLRISELPPSWHQILPANNGGAGGCNSTRFQCVMGDVAVLDKETGLVWQRTPATDLSGNPLSFLTCEALELGGRYGWHLPSMQQLRTLADTSPDHLPDGHPFIGVLTGSDDIYGTSTFLDLGSPAAQVGVVNFDDPGPVLYVGAGTATYRRWCVRGGTPWDQRGGT